MTLIDGITDNKYYGTLQGTPYYQAPTSPYEAIGYLFDKDPNKFSLRSYSRDDTLGRRELERYFKDNNVNLDRNTIEAMLRVYNSKSGKYNYGTNTARNAQDLQLISNALYSAKQGTRRFNPWTGEEYYAGDANYNSGVATEAQAQAIRKKYAPMQEKFATYLLDKAYSNYFNNFTSTETPVKDFEGIEGVWDGKGTIDNATAFKLIKEAGKDGELRIKNSWGNDNLLNNIKYGDRSKKAMDQALAYFKDNNASLYNKLVDNKDFLQKYTTDSSQWEKLNSTVSDKPLGKEDWFKSLTDEQKNQINSDVNNLENLQEFERTQIPTSTTMSTAFNVNNIKGYHKNGGTMRKYQQGGQAPTAAQMVLQALSAAQQGDQSGLQQLFSDKKTAQAVIQQLQKEAQEGSEEAIQALEALKQIMSGSKKQATMAQKGAKLSYIHRLATGCPPGMEMTYFKKGGRICKACIEKAKKAKKGASLDNIIAKNKERYPGITDDQAAGRAPIRKNGKDYYLDGDGVLGEASKKGKYGFGGFFEYFKSGGKNPVKRVSKEITDDGYEMKFSDGTSSNYGRNPMNGKSVAIGRDGKTYTGEKADSVLRTDSQKTVPAIKANKKKSMACGGKAKKSKCGTKAKCGAELEKCGGKTPMDKCGGKTTLAKCGAELEKCGGKAKKISSKKPTVNKDKCGGKAKKHAIGGNLELLKYMILNYNK